MAALLAKFRIDFSDVVVIPDVTKRAKDETRTEFNSIIDSLPEGAAILFLMFFSWLVRNNHYLHF